MDRLMMIQNQQKSVGEQTKTDVFGVINRLVPMFQMASYERSVGEREMCSIRIIEHCLRQ